MKKQYLIYLAQAHVNFRKAELESLAELAKISNSIDLSNYTDDHPFLLVNMEIPEGKVNGNEEETSISDINEKKLDKVMAKWISRGILVRAVYEVWGYGESIEALHKDIQNRPTYQKYSSRYTESSFKFEFVSYQGGKKTRKEIIEVIEQFKYLDFRGPIKMKSPEETFYIFEKYTYVEETGKPTTTPEFAIFCRELGVSDRTRGVIDKFEIASRPYYGTTTFDCELSLVSCNLGLCSRDEIMYDPFVGTGSFMLAASHYGSVSFGSDIDIRTLRGKLVKNKGKNKSQQEKDQVEQKDEYRNVYSNFDKYKMGLLYGDLICMDFTHSCIRDDFKLDSIISDPPYGVREGLKTCGTNKTMNVDLMIEGEKAYLRRDYIQPKKSYDLDLLLDDLLVFASDKLKIGGRLCFWMPCANYFDDGEQIKDDSVVPQHENLELIYCLVQDFNKWSRRLLVYVNRGDEFKGSSNSKENRDTNNFRDRYFKGFH